MHYRHTVVPILEDPGAASWEDGMFSGDNLLQEPRRALTFVPINSSWVSKGLLCPAF